MTAEIKSIRPGLKIDERVGDVTPAMVSHLEELLEWAKTGRLRSLAFAGEVLMPGKDEVSVTRAFDIGSTGSKFTLLAAIRLNEYSLLKSWES